MTIYDLVHQANSIFKLAGFKSSQREAEFLMGDILGWDYSETVTNFQKNLSKDKEAKFRAGLVRRLEGEPLAYIVGFCHFYRHKFLVKEGVLVPRPETEHLVEFAENWIREQKIEQPLVVDLGSGSGCIGISVAISAKAKLVAIDVSPVAQEMTLKNASELGVEASTHFILCPVQELDIKSLLKKQGRDGVDVLLANPPYIADDDPRICPWVKRYEPDLALFGGHDGLMQVRDWLPIIADLLRPGGLFCMEHGATQGKQVVELVNNQGAFEEVTSYKDLAGWERVVTAVRRRN